MDMGFSRLRGLPVIFGPRRQKIAAPRGGIVMTTPKALYLREWTAKLLPSVS